MNFEEWKKIENKIKWKKERKNRRILSAIIVYIYKTHLILKYGRHIKVVFWLKWNNEKIVNLMEKRMANCWIKPMSRRCFDRTLDFKLNVNTIRHAYTQIQWAFIVNEQGKTEPNWTQWIYDSHLCEMRATSEPLWLIAVMKTMLMLMKMKLCWWKKFK